MHIIYQKEYHHNQKEHTKKIGKATVNLWEQTEKESGKIEKITNPTKQQKNGRENHQLIR